MDEARARVVPMHEVAISATNRIYTFYTYGMHERSFSATSTAFTVVVCYNVARADLAQALKERG